jgi:16S rRNA processing protein RimM
VSSTDGKVLLGRVSGAQGLRGEVKINSFTSPPENIAAYGPLTDGEGRSFVIERLRSIKGIAVAAQLAGIGDRNAAEALKGVELYVERDKLPEADEDEWYYDDLIGLDAVSPEGKPIGEVVAVQNFGAGDLLEIRPVNARPTLLVPFTKAAVPVLDMKARRVVVDLAEEEDEQP